MFSFTKLQVIYASLVAILLYSGYLFSFDFALTHNFFQTYLHQWSDLRLWLLSPLTAYLTYQLLIEENNNNTHRQLMMNLVSNPKRARILSPFDDLPWLRGQPFSALVGMQLRIVVHVVHPISETVVDTTVQY